MEMFKSEDDFLNTLGKFDELIRNFANSQIDFQSFLDQYGNFYNYYALDGHESDEEEIKIFEKYDDRLEPHRIIAFDIFGLMCSDEDAEKEIYQKAGRFGSNVAASKLKELYQRYYLKGAK